MGMGYTLYLLLPLFLFPFYSLFPKPVIIMYEGYFGEPSYLLLSFNIFWNLNIWAHFSNSSSSSKY